jgi:hypothetical protein
MNDTPDLSVHDNRLIGYEVHCQNRRIVLHTEYLDAPEYHESTDVVFHDVTCYFFENDSEFGTIIFGIDDVSALDIYDQNIQRFLDNLCYGWPGNWAKSRETAATYFDDHQVCGFELTSSCGMTGWVLAREMRLVSREKPWISE